MQVQNINYNPSFNGAFRLKGLTPELKKEAESVITKGKQIFDNFENTSDMFIVCKDTLDYKVHRFATTNKVGFEYYPQINTKSGLDTDFPELLSKKLKNAKPAPSKNQTTEIIKARKKLYKTQRYADDAVNKVLRTLCIDTEGKEISNIQGAIVVKDPEFSRKIIISPSGKGKVRYVSVVPSSKNEEIKRYAFDYNGNIASTYQTPEGIKFFNKAFKESLITKA